MRRYLSRTLLIAAALLTMAVDCGHLGTPREFVNDTDQDVYLAFQTSLGQPPDDRLLWLHVPARESLVGEAQSCTRSGTFLIATRPDADAVIDRRVLTEDEPWCPRDTWRWTGPGDHD